MKVIEAPNPIPNECCYKVFLAGSIEMGVAERWQDRAIALLSDTDITVLNPRRADWDPSWKQEASNPQFRHQVEWELLGLNKANFVFFYFDPNTKSPITLLELGLVLGDAKADNVYICCPDGYFRRGNVDIVCDSYGIARFSSLEGMVNALKKDLDKLATK